MTAVGHFEPPEPLPERSAFGGKAEILRGEADFPF